MNDESKKVEESFYNNVDAVLDYLHNALEEKDFDSVEDVISKLNEYVKDVRYYLTHKRVRVTSDNNNESNEH